MKIKKYLNEGSNERMEYYEKLKNVKDQKILIAVIDKIVDDSALKRIMRENVYDKTIKDLKSLIDSIPVYKKKYTH